MTSFGLVHCLIALFRILSPALSISWLCPMINHCFCLFVVAKVYNLSMLLKKLTIVVMTRFAFSTSGHEDGLLYHAIPPYTRSSFGGSCFIFTMSLSICFPPLPPTIIWLGATLFDCMYFNWDGDIWTNVSCDHLGTGVWEILSCHTFLTRTCMGDNRWCTWH